jgi:hypothetical protein
VTVIKNEKKVLILANSDSGLYEFRNELVLELLKNNRVIKLEMISESHAIYYMIHSCLSQKG